jgi:signal transduction histidine kinase
VKEITELGSSQAPGFPANHYASLLAGLIHKSNNIITVLSGHSGLLLLEPNLSEKIVEPVRRMSRAAEMLSRYIHEAGVLSKATVLVLEPIAFSDLMEMLTPPSGLTIQRKGRGDVRLRGDRRKLKETFEQILRNAIEAGASSVIVTATKEQSTVCLRFRDNGHGIKAEIMERVFDPFFTTHTQQGRFGLGLFRAKGELARMNGEISAVSDGETYTEILIRIPAA